MHKTRFITWYRGEWIEKKLLLSKSYLLSANFLDKTHTEITSYICFPIFMRPTRQFMALMARNTLPSTWQHWGLNQGPKFRAPDACPGGTTQGLAMKDQFKFSFIYLPRHDKIIQTVSNPSTSKTHTNALVVSDSAALCISLQIHICACFAHCTKDKNAFYEYCTQHHSGRRLHFGWFPLKSPNICVYILSGN